MDRFDTWAEMARSRIRQVDQVLAKEGPVTLELIDKGITIMKQFYRTGKRWPAGERWPYQGPILLRAIGARLGALREMRQQMTAAPVRVAVRQVPLEMPVPCAVCGGYVKRGYVQVVLVWDAERDDWREDSRSPICGPSCAKRYCWDPFEPEATAPKGRHSDRGPRR